jgi:hypothetical protein
MTRRLLNLLVALNSLLCAPLAGCARAYTTFDVFDRHPKFLALKSLLHADAEKWRAGGAASVYYCISVEPHQDAGLTASFGSDDQLHPAEQAIQEQRGALKVPATAPSTAPATRPQ